MADIIELTRASDTQRQKNNNMVNNIAEDDDVAVSADAGRRPPKIRRTDTEVSVETSSIDEEKQNGDADEWDSEGSDGDVLADSESDVGSESDLDSDSEGEEEFSDDEYYSGDELFDEGEDELNTETLLQIKRNDPNVTSLAVYGFSVDDILDYDIDGDDAGRHVGDSTQLKKLTIKGESMEWEGVETRERFLQFSTGLAQNRSLEHVSLRECRLGDNEAAVSTITTLSPLFELNIHLHSLDIQCCNIGDESTRLLASALSRRCRKNSFRRINVDANKISDMAGQELIESLTGYDNLAELSLGDNEIKFLGCIALSNLLSSPKTKLKELNLENNQIDDDGITILTTALSANKTLKELNLSFNCDITQDGWQAFSACLTKSGIEKLDLSSTNIADVGVTALGNSLRGNNSNLKTLNLYDLNSNGIPQVSSLGWHGFFTCLQNNSALSALTQIDLRYSSIDEGGLVALAGAFDSSNSSVKMLDLSHNMHIAAAGWKSFFTCLKACDFTSIEELRLAGNNITDEVLGCLSRALINNETLETLVLGDLFPITKTGWQHLSHLLCDNSSITNIYSSNHSLRYVGQEGIPSDLHSLLLLNQSGNKKEVARDKILHYLFQDDSAINIREFLEMKLKVVPQAISWMGRRDDDTGRTLLYQLLRSLPSLLVSENKVNASGEKRKRVSCA